MQNGQYTLHGWLYYASIIIDVTAKDQNDTLIGRKEFQETIEKYLNIFAREYGMSTEEWLELYFLFIKKIPNIKSWIYYKT